MRDLVIALILVGIVGCATKKIMMKNCAWVQDQIFQCEEIK